LLEPDLQSVTLNDLIHLPLIAIVRKPGRAEAKQEHLLCELRHEDTVGHELERNGAVPVELRGWTEHLQHDDVLRRMAHHGSRAEAQVGGPGRVVAIIPSVVGAAELVREGGETNGMEGRTALVWDAWLGPQRCDSGTRRRYA
jgi:hypothetical protein